MSKAAKRLNNTLVEKLPTTGKDYRVWDTHTPNLNVRVSPSGVKTIYFCYRNAEGTLRWPKIGRAASMTVDEARKIAREIQAQVDKGADPVADRQKHVDAPTILVLWKVYLEQHARPKKKASSVEQDERLWRLHLAPRFSGQKVEAVSLSAIRKMHADMSATPGSANRALALLSKMFSFAVENEWRSDNPCTRVKKYPENKIERYLTDVETQSLWVTLGADKDQCAATIIKVLLLTGARRQEVLTMRWADLDLTSSAPSWTLRAGHQKGERSVRKDLVRPLDPVAANILLAWKKSQAIPSLHWVFPSERKIGSYRTCFKYAWNRIRRTVGIEDVRIHDLRHSFASFAVNSGASLEAIGAALGHKDLRTTQRYAHLTDQTVRGVVNAVSACILDGTS